ncbi:MAG TPA: hypothetical protein VNC50_19015 [Planctomycetia bacterium]|nr:hypothetical protein [Planctomycetia bacterium]
MDDERRQPDFAWPLALKLLIGLALSAGVVFIYHRQQAAVAVERAAMMRAQAEADAARARAEKAARSENARGM